MLCCEIPEGALYYGLTHRREVVNFTEELRRSVRDMLSEMHELNRRGYTPKVRPPKGCQLCSLKEQCLPKLMKQKSATEYISDAIKEDV